MLRVVASQVAKVSDHVEMGEVIWQKTAFVKLQFPLKGHIGHVRPDKAVYYMRGDDALRRKYVIPADPKTCAQLDQRQRWGNACRSWGAVSDAQADAWLAYADKHWVEDSRATSNHARHVFIKVQTYRQAMGLPIVTDCLASPPPPPLVCVEQVATSSPDSFAFRLRCGETPAPGTKVLVELTPAMPSTRRTPRDTELRYACQDTRRCFVDIGEDGPVIQIQVDAARFSITEGQRYGVRVRLVSAEGMPGESTRTDFIRQAPAAQPKPFPGPAPARISQVEAAQAQRVSQWLAHAHRQAMSQETRAGDASVPRFGRLGEFASLRGARFSDIEPRKAPTTQSRPAGPTRQSLAARLASPVSSDPPWP